MIGDFVYAHPIASLLIIALALFVVVMSFFGWGVRCPYCGSYRTESNPSHMHRGHHCKNKECGRHF